MAKHEDVKTQVKTKTVTVTVLKETVTVTGKQTSSIKQKKPKAPKQQKEAKPAHCRGNEGGSYVKGMSLLQATYYEAHK